MIDGRKVLVPILIIRLSGHDIILRRKWFISTSVLINYKNRRLIWPDDQPKTKGWNKILATTKKNLELSKDS